jgi:hypothetical protein
MSWTRPHIGRSSGSSGGGLLRLDAAAAPAHASPPTAGWPKRFRQIHTETEQIFGAPRGPTPNSGSVTASRSARSVSPG